MYYPGSNQKSPDKSPSEGDLGKERGAEIPMDEQINRSSPIRGGEGKMSAFLQTGRCACIGVGNKGLSLSLSPPTILVGNHRRDGEMSDKRAKEERDGC